MTLTYIAPVSSRRALKDCERRIEILEDALAGGTSEVQASANRAELMRLRELREHHALEVEQIRKQRIAHSGRMYQIHRAIADKHYREHVKLLEEARHVKRVEWTATA